MHIVKYRYKIKKSDLNKWKAIYKSLRKVYRKYGAATWNAFKQPEGSHITIIELEYYKNKTEYQSISNFTDKDNEKSKLLSQLNELVIGNISKENFEKI